MSHRKYSSQSVYEVVHDNHNEEIINDDQDYHPVHRSLRSGQSLGQSLEQRQNANGRMSCGSQGQDAFCVPLSFDQELIAVTGGALVPLSTTAGNTGGVRGLLKLKFNSSLSRAAYALYVYNATDRDNRITAGHLHAGVASVNGPVVVALFDGPPRNVNGLLIKGEFDNRDVVGATGDVDAPTINSVGSLYQAIREGALYANVHSEEFPGGIIRGQIYLKNAYSPSQ